MRGKVLAVWRSLLWCLVMLLFPVASGALSVILSLGATETLFLQGGFMLLAVIPPVVLVLTGRWDRSRVGLARFDAEGCKRVWYFIPLLVMFIPAAVRGFAVKSPAYVLGDLFLYLMVGISEELYFRGIIPSCLKQGFSLQGTVLLSVLIFGTGHIAAGLAGMTAFEIVLTVLNAFIFGWLAMEMTIISSNIVPAVLVHFLFDFETKIVVLSGKELLIAESVRGLLMFALAGWLAVDIRRQQRTHDIPG